MYKLFLLFLKENKYFKDVVQSLSELSIKFNKFQYVKISYGENQYRRFASKDRINKRIIFKFIDRYNKESKKIDPTHEELVVF